MMTSTSVILSVSSLMAKYTYPVPLVLLQVGHEYLVIVVAAAMGVFLLSPLCCLLAVLFFSSTPVPSRHSYFQVLGPCSASSALQQSVIHGVAGHIALSRQPVWGHPYQPLKLVLDDHHLNASAVVFSD